MLNADDASALTKKGHPVYKAAFGHHQDEYYCWVGVDVGVVPVAPGAFSGAFSIRSMN